MPVCGDSPKVVCCPALGELCKVSAAIGPHTFKVEYFVVELDGLAGVIETRVVTCDTGGDVRSASDVRRELATCGVVKDASL